MSEYKIVMPSKPRVVLEEGNKGVFEIDGLYPGYGHTLGNSLRRIILSSLPGASITSIKIDGVSHEFQTMDGIKEDVIVLILNLKKARFKMLSDEPQMVTLSIEIMINQLKAIIDFKEPEEIVKKVLKEEDGTEEKEEKKGSDFADVLKTRTDSLDLSTRTLNALTGANIRTLGGLARKKREDLLEVEGIGEKGITEIKKVLNKFGLNLKE